MNIFDIGLFDGSDTSYYLDEGHTVLAVDASPSAISQATIRFADEIEAGRLVLVHAAIAAESGPVELHLSGVDPGSNSTFADKLGSRHRSGSVTVPGIPMSQLVLEHGVPDFMKVDIEGADRYCVLSLSKTLRPDYLSFEIGDDFVELLEHCESIGYTSFKVVQQTSFLELEYVEGFSERASRRLMLLLGYDQPRLVRRGGRFFVSAFSSGPLPWKTGGRWRSGEATRERVASAKNEGRWGAWYDLHATVAPDANVNRR